MDRRLPQVRDPAARVSRARARDTPRRRLPRRSVNRADRKGASPRCDYARNYRRSAPCRSRLGRKKCRSMLQTQPATKTQNSTFAIKPSVVAVSVNPRIATTIAARTKAIAQPNIANLVRWTPGGLRLLHDVLPETKTPGMLASEGERVRNRTETVRCTDHR